MTARLPWVSEIPEKGEVEVTDIDIGRTHTGLLDESSYIWEENYIYN